MVSSAVWALWVGVGSTHQCHKSKKKKKKKKKKKRRKVV